MLLGGIIMLFVSLLALIALLIVSDSDAEEIFIGFILGIAFIIGIALIGTAISEARPKPVTMSTKDNKCSINIETKIVNGKTVSIDTVYVFKKK